VTDTDIAAQRLITGEIRKRFPDHGFLPEEKSDLPTEGPIIWIIDPIDGTTNFSRSLPLFCISVAATRPLLDAKGQRTGFEPLAGAVYDPMRQEMFSGAAGLGATLREDNGRSTPLQISPVDKLDDAVIGLDWGSRRGQRSRTLSLLNRFAHQVSTLRALGSAALALAWVAAGRLDGYLNLNLRPWDIAAAAVLLVESGGQLTAVNSQPHGWDTEGIEGWACNGRIQRPFLQLINRP